MARYCSATINSVAIRNFYWKCWRNWNFYQGEQWLDCYPEDLEAFFRDETGDLRNRIRYTMNMIQPVIQQMVSEGQKMSLNFKAHSVGEMVINRRETELQAVKTMRRLANKFPKLENLIKKTSPIGDDMEETEEIFQNIYTDQLEKNVNNLLIYAEQKNKLKTTVKNLSSESIAVTGLGVIKVYGRGGEILDKNIIPENFFWDTGCTNTDFTDAEFMGEVRNALPTDLYEQYQKLSFDDQERIELYTKYTNWGYPGLEGFPFAYSYTPGHMPVIEVNWRDTEPQMWGIVIDESGYRKVTRVYPNNYKPEHDENNIYFVRDLVKPESDREKDFTEGDKFIKKDVEIVRYCHYTPYEFANTGGYGTNLNSHSDNIGDIVYDLGKLRYQEVDSLDPTKVEMPYKCSTWQYHNGIIVSPIDTLIDPQRFMNRLTSMSEASANNAPQPTVVIDSSFLKDKDEAETARKIRSGKPIFVETRGMGAPQSVTQINQAEQSYQIADIMLSMASNIKSMAGGLVGQFSVPSPKENKKLILGAEEEEQSLHHNYLFCIENLFQQVYQGNLNLRGVYANNPRKLSIIVGDKGAQQIFVTKDMMLEDFRVFVERMDDEKASKQMFDASLTQLRQAQIIDEITFEQWIGRGTMNKLGDVIRESGIRKRMAAKQQQQQQQQSLQLQQLNVQSEKEQALQLHDKEMQNDNIEAEKNRTNKLESIDRRGMWKTMSDEKKAMYAERLANLQKQMAA